MTQVLFDRLKSNLAQCINDGTIYFVKDSNGNFTQIALGDGSKSHVVGIGPKMDDATKQELMSKLGLTTSANMDTIQLGKLSNNNDVSSQKVVTYERTGLGTDTHEISTVGYVHQYMKTAKAMVYAGLFNAQTKEITDYNTAIISPSQEGNVTFDYLLNGNEGETLLTPGMSFIVGTAGDLEGYTGVSVYGGETKVEVGDMIIIINVEQKESVEGGSTYNEASILVIQNTNLKIADGAITTAKLADGAVTASKLSTDIQSLISNLSKTATFAGIATPTTNPGTPDGHVFYIANGKGTYTHFGGIEVTEDEVVIFYYDKEWNKEATGIASQDKLSELDQIVGIPTSKKVVDVEQTINLDTPSAMGYFDLRDLTSFENGALYKIKAILNEPITNPSHGLTCQTRNASNTVVQTLYFENRTFVVGEVVEFSWIKQESETMLYMFSSGLSVNGDYEISHIEEIEGDGLIHDVKAINKILQGGEEVKEIVDFAQTSTSSSYIDITDLSIFVVGQTYKIKVTAIEAKNNVRVITRDASNQNVQILANSVKFTEGETKVYEWTHQNEEVRLFVDAGGNFASHVEISHTEQVVTLPVTERLDTLERRKNGFAHISFDDVVYCLNDITVNANNYTSIFDNSFFAVLKQLHEKYGAKFSLFVFLSDATTEEYATNWTLANTTTKFKNEFAKNASWLKFGLHMSTKNGNYESASAETALDDYSSFVSSVMNFASIDNIDRLPRLANFAGSLDALKAMRDADMGIVGALTAYDSRVSYYLTSDESSMSYKRGQIYDSTNHLMYYTSLKGLETIAPESVFAEKNTIANNLRFFNLEWMMHEYAIGGQNYGYSSYDFATMVERLETACKISVSNGYSFAYPMDIALKAGL